MPPPASHLATPLGDGLSKILTLRSHDRELGSRAAGSAPGPLWPGRARRGAGGLGWAGARRLRPEQAARAALVSRIWKVTGLNGHRQGGCQATHTACGDPPPGPQHHSSPGDGAAGVEGPWQDWGHFANGSRRERRNTRPREHPDSGSSDLPCAQPGDQTRATGGSRRSPPPLPQSSLAVTTATDGHGHSAPWGDTMNRALHGGNPTCTSHPTDFYFPLLMTRSWDVFISPSLHNQPSK